MLGVCSTNGCLSASREASRICDAKALARYVADSGLPLYSNGVCAAHVVNMRSSQALTYMPPGSRGYPKRVRPTPLLVAHATGGLPSGSGSGQPRDSSGGVRQRAVSVLGDAGERSEGAVGTIAVPERCIVLYRYRSGWKAPQT